MCLHFAFVQLLINVFLFTPPTHHHCNADLCSSIFAIVLDASAFSLTRQPLTINQRSTNSALGTIVSSIAIAVAASAGGEKKSESPLTGKPLPIEKVDVGAGSR